MNPVALPPFFSALRSTVRANMTIVHLESRNILLPEGMRVMGDFEAANFWTKERSSQTQRSREMCNVRDTLSESSDEGPPTIIMIPDSCRFHVLRSTLQSVCTSAAPAAGNYSTYEELVAAAGSVNRDKDPAEIVEDGNSPHSPCTESDSIISKFGVEGMKKGIMDSFTSLFYLYPLFMGPLKSHMGGVFNEEAFVGAVRPDYSPFLSFFVTTRMFRSFVASRRNPEKGLQGGAFDVIFEAEVLARLRGDARMFASPCGFQGNLSVRLEFLCEKIFSFGDIRLCRSKLLP
jgi:hypothetical protein